LKSRCAAPFTGSHLPPPNPFLAAPGFLAFAVASVAAWLLYAANPTRPQNRYLAIALALEGVAMGCFGVAALATDPDLSLDVIAVNVGAAALLPTFYLGLLGTLDSPLSRPFHGRRARLALLSVAILVYITVLVRRDLFAPGMTPGFRVPWTVTQSPAQAAVLGGLGLTFFFGLAVAFDAWRRAVPGSLARRQARAFLLAFGVRDALAGTFLIAQVVMSLGAAYDVVSFLGFPVATLTFVALLSYGILKSQLFDIDIKIRHGLGTGTIGLVFLAAFLVVAEVAQQFLSDEFGYLAGGVAAVALLMMLRPIERFSRAFATSLTPAARAIADLPKDERRTLFLEQARAAWSDGMLTPPERRMLDVARARLGLSAEEASTLERDAMPA